MPPVPAIHSIHVAFSSDGGQSFSVAQSIDANAMLTVPAGAVFDVDKYILTDGSPFQVFACSAPAFEVGNRIIIPCYGGNALIPAAIPGTYLSEPMEIYLFESSDGGLTWTKHLVGENHLTDIWKFEPSIIQLQNGKHLMHYRCADNVANPSAPGLMRQAYLDLDDYSFEPADDFSFVGHAPDLIQLNCGVLVSGFRHVNPAPNSADICFIYSINQGFTWSDTICVFEGVVDCGYPTFTEIGPNKLLISYYLSHGSKIKCTVYNFEIKLSSSAEIHASIALSIEESEGLAMSIYPNPCNEIANIKLNLQRDEILNWTILDINGNVIMSDVASVSAGNQNIQINVSDFPSGNYIISLSNNTMHAVEKLIVKH